MSKRKWILLSLVIAWCLWAWGWFFPPRPQVGPLATAAVDLFDSVLIVAPHSDDEGLASAGLIQQVIASGGEVRVVLVTGGEAFTISAQRYYGRLKLGPHDMLAYGETRLRESRNALHTLGVPQEQLTFLGYPDKETARLWFTCWQEGSPCRGTNTLVDQVAYDEARTTGSPFSGEALLRELRSILTETRPSMVVYPHPNDAHQDHWAVSNFVVAALEDLRRAEEDWVSPREWLYVVHRGNWPSPKGYRPFDVLLPPEKLAREAMTTWHELPLTPEQVERKAEAINEYRTQTSIMRRYMHSFIRTNELYGIMERVELWPVPNWEPLTLDTDNASTLETGAPPWSGSAWQLVIADPEGDTVAREVQRRADLVRVWAANNGEKLTLAIRTSTPATVPVQFQVRGRSRAADGAWENAFAVVVYPGGRYKVLHEPESGGLQDNVVAESAGNWVRLELPLSALQNPVSTMINVETRLENTLIDRTAWRLISLDGR